MNDDKFEEELFKQLEIIKLYLLKIGSNIQDAEDIVQDTAYKFLTYLHVAEIENVSSWLFRVSLNSYYDLYRKSHRRKKIMLKFDLKDLFEEQTPEKIILQKETRDDIHYLLDKLNPKYSEFLLLKYSSGLKLDEISHVYNISVDSVKTILYRARKQFILEYGRLHNDQG